MGRAAKSVETLLVGTLLHVAPSRTTAVPVSTIAASQRISINRQITLRHVLEPKKPNKRDRMPPEMRSTLVLGSFPSTMYTHTNRVWTEPTCLDIPTLPRRLIWNLGGREKGSAQVEALGTKIAGRRNCGESPRTPAQGLDFRRQSF